MKRNKQIIYDINSVEIVSLREADKRLSDIIYHIGDLSYTLNIDAYAFMIETIIGQMLSNKAANAISARLYKLCGGELSISTISSIEQSSIKGIGLSNQKASYIKELTSLLHKSPNYFDVMTELDNKEVIKRLTSIRGIGAWSAKMYLIFVLNRLDVLPFEDGAFIQAYKWLYNTDNVKHSAIIKRCEPWKSYSSLAARYLYIALDSGLTRNVDLKLNTNENER